MTPSKTSVTSVLSSINTSPRSPTFQSFSPRTSVPSSPIGHQKMNSSSEITTHSYRDSGYFRDTLTREQMSAQRTIKELEKKVADLTAEIDRSKSEHQESIDLNRTHVRKIKQMELELSQVKIVNKTMLDDNKKYQSMLNDKDAELKELYENEVAKNAALSKNATDSSDLDVEINRSGGERVHKESDHTLIEELQNEIKTLKEDNQSMNQYIQKMLNRIMEVDGFEETLATNWTPESQKKISKVNNSRTSAPVSPSPKSTSNDSSNDSLPLKPRNKSLSDFKFPRTTPPSNSSTANSSSPTTTTSKFSLTPLTTSLINSLSSQNVNEEIIIDNDSGLNNADTTARKVRGSEDNSSNGLRPNTNVPRRSQTMSNGSNKRFSILKWGSYAFGTNAAALAAAKKEDPRMKPILLVEKNRE
ncbi:7722_t:CDS:2 [Dentiscutata heterogama]|uniref:7722_t:CDS:1 n=1 Tax=Dentiscutata heterogama TaxID=1316150 RepID=A0ACA9KER2_9GLOM|nr:7722_t:CDS:2 [Dentiscutata heterogama]